MPPQEKAISAPAIATPVAPAQRIELIDALRGFAIFGILLVNMELFHQSIFTNLWGANEPLGPVEQAARWFIAFFGEGKFYSTFSFLFGLGMALQFARAQSRQTTFVRFWLRRMAVLLAIGLIHAYLFWIGDILILYAGLGAVLLLFYRRRPKTLMIWIVVFLLVPLLINLGLFGLIQLARLSPDGAAMVDNALAEQQALQQAIGADADRVYATGSFGEVTAVRTREMLFMFSAWPFMAFNVLTMMLLGLYAGQRRSFEELASRLPQVRRIWAWGLALGLIGNGLYVLFGEFSTRSMPSAPLLISLLGQTVGAPAFSLFYMATIALLWQHPTWQARVAHLAPVGRMALTNYLLQTVICTTLFYGYGFGFYNSIGIAGGILLTVAIFALQIVISGWWLRRFRFGPMEWLWRTLTYGRRQPMSLHAVHARVS